jgi:hypothetical protein
MPVGGCGETTGSEENMVTIQSEGRRHYLSGNTYPVRDRLKQLGAHWDAGRKAWWTGKREEAEQLITTLNGQQAERERSEGIALDARVIRGRAEYKGKTYYLLVSGEKDGRRYAKLASRDGSLVFWASQEHIGTLRILKEYREPTSIQSLRDYAERAKRGGGGRLQDGYYYSRSGEVLASGCSECSALGEMCRSCEHDFE